MYFHFVDFEKALDSVHRDSLWRITRAYGISDKLIGLVKALYDGFPCAVLDEGEITEIPGGHRREARKLHVVFPVSNGHRLGDEEDGGRTEDRHQMGLYKTTGGQ